MPEDSEEVEDEEEEEEEEEEDQVADKGQTDEKEEKPEVVGASASSTAPARIQIPASVTPYYRGQLEGEPFKAHDAYPEITGAENVSYCRICGFPPDFCQYGACWDKCKPVCIEQFPYLYPELAGGGATALEEAKKVAQESTEKGKIKELPGGKKKREKSPEVTVRKLTRGGRKCVTSITGLEGFGVKLDAAAKLFKKKFACGSSVVKGDAGQPDSVDIQGDFEDEVCDLIVENFKEVPRDKIVSLAEGTKKKGKAKS
mmetsp:Transcript_14423/g.26584  ORF Transcript_14423/g.26584 Transcript_14423/m.26584 type:complete len:258 (+) Transcript_14423:53-826(+)